MLIRVFLIHPTFRAIVINRLYNRYKFKPFKLLCKIYNSHLRTKYHIEIPLSVKIGNSPMFPHEGSVVINFRCEIGDNVTIFPGVLIGSKPGGCPKIGNNVVIGSGAKIIGGITIEDNIFIAPNSVVVKNQKENTTIGGIPSHIINNNGIKSCKTYAYNRY